MLHRVLTLRCSVVGSSVTAAPSSSSLLPHLSEDVPPTYDVPSALSAPSIDDELGPIFEGSGQYYRNTTLKERLPGYAKRWKWHAGFLQNDMKLPFETKQREMANGSWFAVPHLGRRVQGKPHFHVLTANHVMHPFLYPELYNFEGGLELIKYASVHDVSAKLFTATPDGERSASLFRTVPELTYAHPLRHLDMCVLHPSALASESFVNSGGAFRHAQSTSSNTFSHEQSIEEQIAAEVSDASCFPFHFQLLSFDCAPLTPGERVMVHGHSVNTTMDLHSLMRPNTMRCTVLEAKGEEAQNPLAGEAGYVVIESEKEEPFPHGVCGGPVLRDGNVVGMLIACFTDEPHKALCVSSAALRSFLLRIEDAWRYPAPPSTNFLRDNGLLSGHLTHLPPTLTGGTNEVVPTRYLPPSLLPTPTTSKTIREYADLKFNDPLPKNFQPPALTAGGGRQIVSRDRTNPYGELPADSALGTQCLPIFPGYPDVSSEAQRAGVAEASDELPGWLLKYGSTEAYLLAQGVRPQQSGVSNDEVLFFKNYSTPEAGGAGGGLMLDVSERETQKYLANAGEAEVEEVVKETPKKKARDINMDAFFGKEEYIAQRTQRVEGRLLAYRSEVAGHLADDSVEGKQRAEEVREEADSFIAAERELSWVRGDVRYQSEESKGFQAELSLLEAEKDNTPLAITANDVNDVNDVHKDDVASGELVGGPVESLDTSLDAFADDHVGAAPILFTAEDEEEKGSGGGGGHGGGFVPQRQQSFRHTRSVVYKPAQHDMRQDAEAGELPPPRPLEDVVDPFQSEVEGSESSRRGRALLQEVSAEVRAAERAEVEVKVDEEDPLAFGAGGEVYSAEEGGGGGKGSVQGRDEAPAGVHAAGPRSVAEHLSVINKVCSPLKISFYLWLCWFE